MYAEDMVVPVEETTLSLRLELAVEKARALRFEWLVEQMVEKVRHAEAEVTTHEMVTREHVERETGLKSKIMEMTETNLALMGQLQIAEAELKELKPKEPPSDDPRVWPSDEELP